MTEEYLTGEELAKEKRRIAQEQADRIFNDPAYKRDPEVLAQEEAGRLRSIETVNARAANINRA